MLWEKKDIKNSEKRGYLYLRETLYVRDKRAYTRKPKKLGSGKAYKERGKYSKKKDYYCGKIEEIFPKKFITFREYLETINLSYLEFKLNSGYFTLLDKFIDYLLIIYDIEPKNFKLGPKKAYELSTGGYLSREIIDFLKRFIVKKDPTSKKEIERFANRCFDCGIYDNEVIMALYVKISPEITNDISQELKDLRNKKMVSSDYDSYLDFMKQQHKY